MSKKKPARFEGKIETLCKAKPFYMVWVEGAYSSPTKKHETYEEAFSEMLRLSAKENKKAYVMQTVTQVEQFPNVIQFNHP